MKERGANTIKPILRLISIFLIGIALSLIHMNYVYPGIAAIKQRELKIAYLNGFIAALDLPPDLIERIKKDPELLKKEALASVDAYIRIVDEMNADKKKGKESYLRY